MAVPRERVARVVGARVSIVAIFVVPTTVRGKLGRRGSFSQRKVNAGVVNAMIPGAFYSIRAPTRVTAASDVFVLALVVHARVHGTHVRIVTVCPRDAAVRFLGVLLELAFALCAGVEGAQIVIFTIAFVAAAIGGKGAGGWGQ